MTRPAPRRLPDDDALDSASSHLDPAASRADVLASPPSAAASDVMQQWRESAARAAGRAYDAAYGREIPEASSTTRWAVSARVAAAVAIGVVALGAGAWWLAGPGRAAPHPLESPPDSLSPGGAEHSAPAQHGHGGSEAVSGPASSAPGAAAVVVHVSGAVGTPGLVELPAGSRVADAVTAAGGMTDGADQAGVNLAREAVDGEHIHVPAAGEQAQAAGPLAINLATAEELEELPGVGPVIAERIVADRDANGPFRSLDDIQRVSGVGPALVARWEGLAQV